MGRSRRRGKRRRRGRRRRRGGGGGGGIGGGGGGFRNLEEVYGDKEVSESILDKLLEEKDDNSYIKIYDNMYIRNYIGFENMEQIQKFLDIDFRKNYRTIFPNVAAIVFGYMSFIPMLVSIIFSISRLLYKDVPNQTSDESCVACVKFLIIINYAIFFIGYFIYFVVKYLDIIKEEKEYSLLKKYSADIFIEDFLKYFYSKNDFEKIFVIVELSLILFSLVVFVLGWIVHIIVMREINRRNKMWNNKKNNN